MVDSSTYADVDDIVDAQYEAGPGPVGTALAPASPVPHSITAALVAPAAPVEQIVAVMKAYEEIIAKIMHPSDYTVVEDKKNNTSKRYPNKSYFDKLANIFSCSTDQVHCDIVRDPAGNILRATYRMRAIAPNGRYAEGTGVCSITEDRFNPQSDYGRAKARAKADHDVLATAETRARNRAYSALFGNGVVSAEEVLATAETGGTQEGAVLGGDRGGGGGRAAGDFPKASPNKPASANQLATIAKLSRLLGQPEDPREDMSSAEASDRITDLSREYNERRRG